MKSYSDTLIDSKSVLSHRPRLLPRSMMINSILILLHPFVVTRTTSPWRDCGFLYIGRTHSRRGSCIDHQLSESYPPKASGYSTGRTRDSIHAEIKADLKTHLYSDVDIEVFLKLCTGLDESVDIRL